jgi:hypothetical protein
MVSECIYFEFSCTVRPSSERFLVAVIQYLVDIFNCLIFMRLLLLMFKWRTSLGTYLVKELGF